MAKPILIAHDNEDDLTVTRQTLKKAGAKNPIVAVDDGDKVIAYLKGEGKFENREKYPIPAILFLDLKMRQVNGFQVMEWIRDTKFGDILIVALKAAQIHDCNDDLDGRSGTSSRTFRDGLGGNVEIPSA